MSKRSAKGSRWRQVRRAVLERDGWRCCACGRSGRLEVDHITPLADGGAPLDLGNLQTLCRSCHIAKTSAEVQRRYPPEVREWLNLRDALL